MVRPSAFAYWDQDADTAHKQWKTIMAKNLQASKAFEIHCWKDERKEIEMALAYGSIKKTDWEGGSVIEGAVTPKFIHFLLTLSKPDDTEVFYKMTPFFSIFLDNGFSSEHYGTELNQQ